MLDRAIRRTKTVVGHQRLRRLRFVCAVRNHRQNRLVSLLDVPPGSPRRPAHDFFLGEVQEKTLRRRDEKVMGGPAGEPGRDVKKTDQAVLTMVPDRTHKAQAPEPLVPNNRFGSSDGSVKHFIESRSATEDFLKSTAGLRDHVTDRPLGKLGGYEFVLFIAAHSERHTKQINEVKADPNFPKK